MNGDSHFNVNYLLSEIGKTYNLELRELFTADRRVGECKHIWMQVYRFFPKVIKVYQVHENNRTGQILVGLDNWTFYLCSLFTTLLTR
jgi:hypothetical protein